MVYVEVMDPFGVPLTQIDDYLALSYTRVTNGVGVLTLDLSPDIERDLFRLDSRLGVWRQPAGGSLALDTETVWLVRRVRRTLDAKGERRLQVTAYSASELLARRIVAYTAGSAQAAKTDYVDDMMKEIVAENLGGDATDADRDWSALLDVAADLGAADSVSKAFAWRNVLTVLQELGEANGVYFDVVSPTRGALEFRTYISQRGQDRTLSSANPLIVSPEMGNLATGDYAEDYSAEASCVYAGGQGVGADREVSEVEDATRIGASPFGRREAFADARGGATGNSLDAEAAAALFAGRPRRLFAGKIADTPQCRYGLHWGWGDKVTAQFEGESFDCHVSAVKIAIASGRETIDAQLRAEESL